VTDRETTDRAETRRALLEEFQLLNDGIDSLVQRIIGQSAPTAA
jgi:hypothetical protein